MNAPDSTQIPPPLPNAGSSSVYAKMANVFATPGETFEEVSGSPQSTSNWAIPTILAAVIGAVCVWILFSQPAMQQQIREAQTKVFEEKVKAGKLSQQQADAAIEAIDRFAGPRMMKIFGCAGALVAAFGRLFWWGLVILLLGHWLFKSNFHYMKGLEVVGLASLVTTLGAVVSLLLAVNLNQMYASPGLALFVREFDPLKTSHAILASINLFTIWFLVLLGVGLARLARCRCSRAILAVCAFWIAQQSLLILAGKVRTLF